MQVLYTFPPNYSDINKAFNIRGKPVIFAYGNVMHNPSRIVVPPELMVHERVHQQRQGRDPAGWWRRYIDDCDFRLAEEIPAHQAEWRALKSGWRDLERIARRLASPLYGSMVDVDRAMKLLAP